MHTRISKLIFTAAGALLAACSAYDRPTSSVPPEPVRGAVVSSSHWKLSTMIPDGWRRYIMDDGKSRRLSIENASLGASIHVDTLDSLQPPFELAEAARAELIERGFNCKAVSGGNSDNGAFADFTCQKHAERFKVTVLRPFDMQSHALFTVRLSSPPAVRFVGHWSREVHGYCNAEYDTILKSTQRE